MTQTKGSNVLRTLFYSLTVLILVSGCSGPRTIQVDMPDEDKGEWVSERVDEPKKSTSKRPATPSRMYQRKKEAKYVIKPEPYSVKSKKKDPELLGPQRTYNAENGKEGTSSSGKKTHKKSTMTEASCISMIGQEKYYSYVKKYGGKKGALRRCLIIKRLRG